jgi:GNAT superfamily N-acetyltransferase
VIERFLREFLGAWPPTSDRDVVASPLRSQPGWDGVVRDVWGVRDGDGRWVVSVSEARAALADPLAGLTRFEGTFRYCERAVAHDAAGRWVPADDPLVPPWLRPFGHDVLVELDDDGAYLAGVGIKRHLDSGWEISVGTEERARGRGLARRLVATAAAYILDHGAVALYLHADDNHASAKVAEASGFPDLGWRVLTPPDPGDP